VAVQLGVLDIEDLAREVAVCPAKRPEFSATRSQRSAQEDQKLIAKLQSRKPQYDLMRRENYYKGDFRRFALMRNPDTRPAASLCGVPASEALNGPTCFQRATT
jgi:hypothetical protein